MVSGESRHVYLGRFHRGFEASLLRGYRRFHRRLSLLCYSDSPFGQTCERVGNIVASFHGKQE